jgi:hypothetical protein
MPQSFHCWREREKKGKRRRGRRRREEEGMCTNDRLDTVAAV